MPIECAHEPYALFSLFFTKEIFVELAVNTNKYAEIKRKGQGRERQARMIPVETPSNMHSQKWTPTSASKLKIWFRLTIKMGIHREPSISLHWSKEGRNG